jgi:hypothetical protein
LVIDVDKPDERIDSRRFELTGHTIALKAPRFHRIKQYLLSRLSSGLLYCNENHGEHFF